MINKLAKVTMTTLLVAGFTASVQAGSLGGPKPKCPMGQLPVLKNGAWFCEDAKIQAKPSGERNFTASGSKVVKMPGRAKADLSIANMFKQNDPNPSLDKFRVYVKNTGSVDSPASKMSINSSSGGGEVSVPAIVANSGQWVEVQFFAFEDGSRIRLMIDSHKKVAESNESNNVYAFNW